MFELKKTFNFEAGHVLTHHDGKCATPHGHSYEMTVIIRSDQLISSGPKTNMVMDFQDINKIVKSLIDQSLDHCWLNDSLDCESPTAEYIAMWIYNALKPSIPGLYGISLAETCTCSVIYTPNQF